MRLLLITILGSLAGSIFAGDAAPKLPTGDEFTKLRMAFAAQADFNPAWRIDDVRDAILKAAQEKDYAKVAQLSKPWLEKVPVDADIHFVRAQALKRLGDWTGFSYHWHCFYGLIHSIASTGDGKSSKTAFKVISVTEEYYLLDEIGAQLIDQRLSPPCDVMHVKMRDGSEATFYFDVTIPLAAEARLLAPKK